MQGAKRKKGQRENHFGKKAVSLIDDHNFLEEMKMGNEEALRYVIGKYGGLVRSVIAKHLYLLKEEQEECFDDVFLNVWEHIDSFDGQLSTFQNWIAGIARYRSIDYLRRYRKRMRELFPERVV